QPVEREPGDDPHQEGTRVTHLVLPVLAERGPPQPGLLHDVLGVGDRAEHLVGDGEQQAAVGDEGLLAHPVDATPRSASGGIPQAAAKPSDSMPRATLPRVLRLAKAMTEVSSTNAADPRAPCSRPTSSSVTVGGV